MAATPPLLLLLLALLRGAAAQDPQWAPLGAPIFRVGLLTASLSFDDGASVNDDGVPAFPAGTPLVAVGAGADTRIDLLRFNGTAWSLFASHTPAFSQTYADFSFDFARGRAFVGLAITSDGALASVLRSGDAGSDGRFEGCWAFAADAFDYAVNGDGDLRVVAAAGGNATLSTYNHSGYASYPAADAFGPLTLLPAAADGSATTAVSVATDGGGRDVLVAALASAAAVRVVATTLSTVASAPPRVVDVGSPLVTGAAVSVAVAVGGGAVCTALVTDGALRVLCVDEGAGGAAAWTDLGRPAASDAATGTPTVARTGARGVVVAAARADADGVDVLTALCQLPPGAVGACVGGWRAAAVTAAASQVLGVDVRAFGADGTTEKVCLAVRDGGGVRVFQLA